MTTINEKPGNALKKWVEFLETNNTQSMIDLVKYPVITEKTYLSLYKNRQYTFDIDKRLTKVQIKKLFSTLFNVTVLAVNTHIPPRKKIRVGMAQGFRPTFKRAIITLKEGDSINYNLSNINNENK
jgi:large subunit ribosomal protein L23